MSGIGFHFVRRVSLCLTALAIAAPAQILFQGSGARQMGMGKGGVALPDGSGGTAFNPALPALALPWDKVSVGLHPDWMVLWEDEYHHIRQKAWNGPSTGTAGMGPAFDAFFRIPSFYLPRLGYIGFDQGGFTSDFIGSESERIYSLTLSPAVDFLGEDQGRSERHAWSFGLTLKYYEFEDVYGGLGVSPPDRFSASGFAFDLGAAGRTLPSALPGVRLDWGLAFANLGPAAAIDYEGTTDFEALSMRYRAGCALAYTPFRRERFPPFRILLQQDFSKLFAERRSERTPYPFFLAFFKDMDAPLARYWRETESHTGLETTWFDLAHLRAGRSQDWYSGKHPWYTFGYGLDSGPLLGPGYLRFDYGRELGTRGRRRDNHYFPLRREYGVQAGWRF